MTVINNRIKEEAGTLKDPLDFQPFLLGKGRSRISSEDTTPRASIHHQQLPDWTGGADRDLAAANRLAGFAIYARLLIGGNVRA